MSLLDEISDLPAGAAASVLFPVGQEMDRAASLALIASLIILRPVYVMYRGNSHMMGVRSLTRSVGATWKNYHDSRAGYATCLWTDEQLAICDYLIVIEPQKHPPIQNILSLAIAGKSPVIYIESGRDYDDVRAAARLLGAAS